MRAHVGDLPVHDKGLGVQAQELRFDRRGVLTHLEGGTKEGVRTRVAVPNPQPYPPPSVSPRQQAAPGGEKYETPEWLLQGYAWETMPEMDRIFEEFNREFGTEFEFQLQPKAKSPR